jgi:predicted transcriptional regulator
MKNDQHEQARNLYLETGLTQSQIAELVGISQKTVSLWVSEGQWARLKRLAKEMPGIAVDSMFTELTEINNAVRNRPEGMRYATLEEAEIRRKILASIKYVQEHRSAGSHIEVMMNFILYMKPLISNPELKMLIKHADSYLKAEEFLPPDVKKWHLRKFSALPEEPGQPLAQTREEIAKEIDETMKGWKKLQKQIREQSQKAVNDALQ